MPRDLNKVELKLLRPRPTNRIRIVQVQVSHDFQCQYNFAYGDVSTEEFRLTLSTTGDCAISSLSLVSRGVIQMK